jgi:hypothetical protein
MDVSLDRIAFRISKGLFPPACCSFFCFYQIDFFAATLIAPHVFLLLPRLIAFMFLTCCTSSFSNIHPTHFPLGCLLVIIISLHYWTYCTIPSAAEH